MSAGRRAGGPNVLLVVFDTARVDAFEPYGAPSGSSPAVAQLAARGQVARTAFATSCWTVPSHASMFTGLLPRALGLRQDGIGTPAKYAPAIRSHADRMLPTVFGHNGYATAGVSANLWVSRNGGFDTGFDSFRSVRSPRKAKLGDRSWKGRAAWAYEALKARADDGARAVERNLDDWMGNAGGKPFFWFVNLVECHSPYMPPKPYTDLGPIERVLAGDDAQRHQTFRAFSTASLGHYDVPEQAIRRMRRQYSASIRLMDGWLARVQDALDRHGLLDETLILLTSDHGENFGECELMGHGFSLDDRLIRIPMIAAGPQAPEFDGVMSLCDIPALLAGACGVDEHPWPVRSDKSVAVAQLEATCAPDDEFGYQVCKDWGLGERAHEILVTPLACATDGRYKLLRRGDSDILIDLAADPLETAFRDPAPADGPPVPERLRKALDAAQSDTPAGSPSPTASASGEDVDVDDLKARMELLGYM